jgi:hypothetical protein
MLDLGQGALRGRRTRRLSSLNLGISEVVKIVRGGRRPGTWSRLDLGSDIKRRRDRRHLIGERLSGNGVGHLGPPSPSAASWSSTTPKGPDGFPRASRIKAWRKTSSGTPYCRAIDATTAQSLAMMPAMLLTRVLLRRISPTLPSEFTLLPLLNPDRDNLARIPLPAFPRQGEQSPRSCIGLQARLGLTGFDIAALIRNPG